MTRVQQLRLRQLTAALRRARQAEEKIIKAVELLALGFDGGLQETADARQYMSMAEADLSIYEVTTATDRETQAKKREK